MARSKRRSQLDAIDEINMTPLIDLTFLLLIIFMITAPLMEYGIDVSPPEMNADNLPDKNTKSVNIDKTGKIIFNDQPVSKDDLLKILQALKESSPKTMLLLRADGERPYKDIIELMRAIKNSGFSNVSLVTSAEDSSS
ncbi:biopolymer transporter ExbD [Lentisphaerota bacterium ZTH]|nr:biopolymer transporter ExbD [Lentisphaerota bacterium]WET06351.1 biopolymer transporter ExbD [Lentisphaerota bacterium ZTH]